MRPNPLPAPDRYYAGDTLVLELTVRDADADGDPKDLLGADVEYAILELLTNEVVIDESDPGVDVEITDTSGGELTVEIDADATESLSGTYIQRLRIVDNDGRRNTYTSELAVHNYE